MTAVPTSLVRRLVSRYGRPELAGCVGLGLGFVIGYVLLHSLVTGASLASLGETIAYYGYIGLRALHQAQQATQGHTGLRRAWRIARHAISEHRDFIVAELMDLALRAWLIYSFSRHFSDGTYGVLAGLILGKLCADVVYYTVASLVHVWTSQRPQRSGA